MRKILTAILVFVAFISHAQIQERQVKATETLETGNKFIYKTVDIPVADVTYHQFSADSVTWRKNYVAGDCYVRFSNVSSNPQGTHASWWGLNICNLGRDTLGGLDTLYVYYYSSDTISYIDTIVSKDHINIPAPDTLTGSTINFQDTLSHTHAVYLNLDDLQDVDASPTDGQVLKWNSVSEQWEAANDLIGGGGGGLTVKENDSSPSVTNVNTINVENGTLTNNGAGVVSIDFMQEAVTNAQDFYRAGTDALVAGDNFVEFTSPFSDNDYVLASVYALYEDSTRQNLVWDSLAADGFRVIGVVDDATVNYIAIRDLDSLGLAVENVGKVMASGTDPTMSYLNGAVDDSTITVINEELHVIPEFDTLRVDTLRVKDIQFTDTYWTDMSIPLTAAAGGASAPDLEAFRGSTIKARAFAGTVVNETVFVEGQFSHAIKDSSDIYPHFHFAPSTTPISTDTVVVELEYTWAAYNDVFPTSSTITTKIPLNGIAQWQHAMKATTAIAAIGDQASSIFMARITRLQDNASDTYAHDVFIFNFDIHFEMQGIGSRNIIPD